jgi:hypothetical protein
MKMADGGEYEALFEAVMRNTKFPPPFKMVRTALAQLLRSLEDIQELPDREKILKSLLQHISP